MKVLVINGSPKGKASDTLCVTHAFLEGLGEDAEELVARELHIKPCLGCFGCWDKTPGKCVQQDDMQSVFAKIYASDLVIWSAPLYCYGFPAPAKAIIDRLLPDCLPQQVTDAEGRTAHPSRMQTAPRMMLISGGGFPDREGNYDGLIFSFRRLFGDSPMIITPESPMFHVPSARPLTDRYLAFARKAGEEMRTLGAISSETQAVLDTPMIPPQAYRASCSER